MKNFGNFFWGNPYIKNLLIAVGIVAVLVAVALHGVEVYTQHGKAVIVPDVKGLQVEDAARFFEKNSLRYEVIDSSFVKNAIPGSIIEITPQAGFKVKKNRIIYLTINAFSTQTLTVPEVRDLSQRQAIAMLSAIGFERIGVEPVDGIYRDLVVGLTAYGKGVNSGDKLPVSSRLVLQVSSGNISTQPDSVVIETTSDESWY